MHLLFSINIESVNQKAAAGFPALNLKYVITSSFRQVASHSF